jgi:hypothetical protein
VGEPLKRSVRHSILMPLMKVILSTWLLLGAAELSYARQWRGLVPLRSTRSDVVRLLNQCSDQREACRFTLDKEDVHILFSGGLPSEYGQCGARLAPETIMFIEIEPRGKLKLRDLRLDKRTLQSFNPSAPFNRGLKGYRSSDGLVLSLFKDEILQIFYIADESDKHRCFAYYQQPESFVEMSIDHVEVIHAIDCPESIKAGEQVVVSAHSTMNETRGYKWELNAGRIIAGQYTKQITVDTTGLAGQKITITAEIGDVFGHNVTGSCVVQILANQGTFRAR